MAKLLDMKAVATPFKHTEIASQSYSGKKITISGDLLHIDPFNAISVLGNVDGIYIFIAKGNGSVNDMSRRLQQRLAAINSTQFNHELMNTYKNWQIEQWNNLR